MSEKKDNAFFRFDGDLFIGNGAARGPWTADACHGGPVAALLARAIEQGVPDKQLARLTVNLCRPVPMSGVQVKATVEGNGRSAAFASATLRDREDRLCATASSVLLATHSFADMPTASIAGPTFKDAQSGHFSVTKALHGLPFFGNGIEVAYPPEESADSGPGAMWIRSLPIVAGESASPFQTLCPIADCGNGMSRNGDFSDYSFVNADITVAAYRLPESDWLAAQAISFWEPTGIGLSQALLFDTAGSVGTALQTLIVRPVG